MRLNITLTHNSNKAEMDSASDDNDFALSPQRKHSKRDKTKLEMVFEGDKNFTGTEFVNAMNINSTSKSVQNIEKNKTLYEVNDSSENESCKNTPTRKKKLRKLEKKNQGIIQNNFQEEDDGSSADSEYRGSGKLTQNFVNNQIHKISDESSEDGNSMLTQTVKRNHVEKYSVEIKDVTSDESDKDNNTKSAPTRNFPYKPANEISIEVDELSEESDEVASSKLTQVVKKNQVQNRSIEVNDTSSDYESNKNIVIKKKQLKNRSIEVNDTSSDDESNKNIVIKKKQLKNRSIEVNDTSSDDESNKNMVIKKKQLQNKSIDVADESSQSSDLDESITNTKKLQNFEINKQIQNNIAIEDSSKNSEKEIEEMDINKFSIKENLTPVEYDPISDLLKESKEVFIVNIPNNLKPNELRKMELLLTENKNITINGQDYHTDCKNDDKSINLMSKINDKYSIKSFKSQRTVTIKRAYSNDDVICFKVKKANVKPILQTNSSDACFVLDKWNKKQIEIKQESKPIDVSSNKEIIREKVDESNKSFNGTKSKKKRRLETKIEGTSEETFSTDYSESNSSKKKKKKKNKHNSIDEEVQNVSESSTGSKKKKTKEIEVIEDRLIKVDTLKSKKKNKHKKLLNEECAMIASSTFIDPNEKIDVFDSELSTVDNDSPIKKHKTSKDGNESFESVSGPKIKRKKKKNHL